MVKMIRHLSMKKAVILTTDAAIATLIKSLPKTHHTVATISCPLTTQKPRGLHQRHQLLQSPRGL